MNLNLNLDVFGSFSFPLYNLKERRYCFEGQGGHEDEERSAGESSKKVTARKGKEGKGTKAWHGKAWQGKGRKGKAGRPLRSAFSEG